MMKKHFFISTISSGHTISIAILTAVRYFGAARHRIPGVLGPYNLMRVVQSQLQNVFSNLNVAAAKQRNRFLFYFLIPILMFFLNLLNALPRCR